MSLQRLLEQATPGPWRLPTSAVWFWSDRQYRREPMERFKAQADLIALAPDAIRLLTDMAAYIKRGNQEAYVNGMEEHALLARFAALNKKAGT